MFQNGFGCLAFQRQKEEDEMYDFFSIFHSVHMYHTHTLILEKRSVSFHHQNDCYSIKVSKYYK